MTCLHGRRGPKRHLAQSRETAERPRRPAPSAADLEPDALDIDYDALDDAFGAEDVRKDSAGTSPATLSHGASSAQSLQQQQQQQQPGDVGAWMAGRAHCPTCNARFCIADIRSIQTTNQP